ncbi:putative transposase [Klebsiella pneumoniae subsp. pneumoniae Kp13]|nr:putative transposase [Klebsiella pneumoniae subsp. pneumoniae Kp13]
MASEIFTSWQTCLTVRHAAVSLRTAMNFCSMNRALRMAIYLRNIISMPDDIKLSMGWLLG